MKIIYCIRATYNPGGMERVLLNKVTYLVNKLHWDVTIVPVAQLNHRINYLKIFVYFRDN